MGYLSNDSTKSTQRTLFFGRNREQARTFSCSATTLQFLHTFLLCQPKKQKKPTQILQRENNVKVIVTIHSHYSYSYMVSSAAIVLLKPIASAKGHSANISFVRHHFRITTLVLGSSSSSSVTKAQCVTIFFPSTIPTLRAVRGVASRLTKKKSHLRIL